MLTVPLSTMTIFWNEPIGERGPGAVLEETPVPVRHCFQGRPLEKEEKQCEQNKRKADAKYLLPYFE